tara:strand:+ start:1089 stop:1418 length:330 start_codon:yes stop_codon:yes gene_type:complete
MIFKKKEKDSKKKIKIKSYDLIFRPIVTEKATTLSSFSQFILSVPINSNKNDIKNAVESLFGVNVKKVNLIISKGKIKRFKGIMGKRKDVKKAIISLEKGQKIDITTGV